MQQPIPVTRNSPQCSCSFCSIGRKYGGEYLKYKVEIRANIGKKSQTESKRICDTCKSEVSPGLAHNCNKTTRRDNLFELVRVLVSSSFQDTFMQLKSSVPATGCCTTSLSLQSIILLRLISSNILTEEAMVQKVLVTGQSRLWKVVIMTSKSFGPTQKLIKITLTLLKGSLVPLLNIIALISR